jgi:hypothetical protein
MASWIGNLLSTIQSVLAGQGTNTDIASVNSVFGRLQKADEHVHSSAKVYPELASPITLTKGAGAWAAYPASKTEIVPVNTIVAPFDIHFILVDTISANGNYTVKLYSGLAGAEVEIAVVSVVKTAAASQEGALPITCPIQPANTRISAAISSSNAAANTLNLKVHYHTY